MRLKNYQEPESVKTKFYYVRTSDESKFPVVSVCLKHDTASGEVSRGIAICATDLEAEHKRSKRVGRNIAETRAKWAMHNNAQHLEIKEIERFHIIAQKFIIKNDLWWLCDNAPTLSLHELDILGLKSNSDRIPMKTTAPAILPVKNGILTRFWDWAMESMLID